MVIETRINFLKHRTKRLELTDREKKLILLLSDNTYHRIKEIRKYVGYITDIQTRLLIRKLNKKTKESLNIKLVIKKENKQGITGLDKYQIKQQIYIS